MPKNGTQNKMQEAEGYLKGQDSLTSLAEKSKVLDYETDGSLSKRGNYTKSYYSFKEYNSFQSERTNI